MKKLALLVAILTFTVNAFGDSTSEKYTQAAKFATQRLLDVGIDPVELGVGRDISESFLAGAASIYGLFSDDMEKFSYYALSFNTEDGAYYECDLAIVKRNKNDEENNREVEISYCTKELNGVETELDLAVMKQTEI